MDARDAAIDTAYTLPGTSDCLLPAGGWDISVGIAALLVNKGTIPFNLAPGEEQNSQIRDVLYPAGTAWYKFRIIGATPTVQ